MQPDENLAELLVSKEQEWKELQALRVSLLEGALKDTKRQLQDQGQEFNKLKEDFTYNLRLLEERDRELERYDAMFTRLKMVENTKQAEVSELKIQIEKLQQAVNKEIRNREGLEHQYQQRLKEHQLELERIRSSKDVDIDRHREEYEKLKRQLERKIQEVEGELDLQKQELMLDFDAEMKKREHEFRLQADEMGTMVLSHELKVKLLSKELDVLKETGIKSAESLQTAEAANVELEREVKRLDWALKDMTAVKDARIKDLKNKLQEFQMSWKKEEETFQRKHERLDRFAREKDAALKVIKQAHTEREQALEKQIKELQVARETLEMEQRRMQWSHADTLAEKEAIIETLQGEKQNLKTGWDSHIAQISTETVSKDLKLQSLQEEEIKLKAELTRCHQDVERYKQQLSQAVARERMLEQAKVQVELDWQKRCENAERIQYQKSEEVIQSLTTARDQLAAELQEKDRNLQEAEALHSALTIERDRAVDELHQRRVIPERENQAFVEDEKRYPAKHFPSSEIQKLQEQNSGLRAVIAEMRKEMEALSEPTAPLTQRAEKSEERKLAVSLAEPSETTDSGYIRSLEEEIRTWKQKCRIAEEKLEDLSMATKKSPPTAPAPKVSTENAYIQSHVRALNETIGALRADKVTSAAATKKLETRVAHLDSMVKQLTQKLGQKQVDNDQLQYELTNRTQQNRLELSAAHQRVSELELQLTEARKEAEEYFKGNLQQNLEAVVLGNEVAALKLDLACNRAPVVVQESSVIKQLQEEILRLRQKLNTLCYSEDEPQQPSTFNIQLLQTKLKDAMSRILHLSREKEQLIDLGNRLRADLMSVGNQGFTPSSASPLLASDVEHSAIPTAQPSSDAPSRLSALEQLQYQLTTQELQYAQRHHHRRVADTGRPSSAESWDVQNIQHNRANMEEPPRTKRVMQSSSSKNTPNQLKENTPSNLRQPQNRNGVKNPFAQPPGTSSSGEDGAFQEIWQILEMGSSPSTLSSRDHTEQDLQPVRDVMRNDGVSSSQKKTNQSPQLKGNGKKSEVQQKAKSNRSLYDRTAKTKTPPNSRRIRNYNVRD